MLTERQKEILNLIVKDYIELAEPISSEFLDKKHQLDISPATIRIEFQKLTKEGYLYQPHTSAGRIPTEKAYRFFVDSLLKDSLLKFEVKKWIKQEMDNSVKFLRLLTKNLAEVSEALVFVYLKEEDLFWKEGWEGILKEPEFFDKNYLLDFLQFLKEFERKIKEIEMNSKINIFIGKESPFRRGKNFTTIISKCCLPEGKETIFSLLGPTRMNYQKNISVLISLKRCLENL